jgi:hypothetical protein
MNDGFEQEPFSVAKLVAGGIAVVLIMFIGVTMWLPPRPSPAAPAKTTAQPWDAALVVAAPPPTPRQPPSAAPPAPPVSAAPPPAVAEPPAERAPAPSTATQPVEPRSATALSSRFLDILRSEDPEDAPPRRQAQEPLRRQVQEPLRRRAQEPPRSAGAERNPLNRSDTASIQRKLQELGYYAGDDNGAWGDASRRALQDFKRMNGLQEDDKRDRETEAQLLSAPGVHASRTFIGRWALGAEECLQRVDGTQLIIDTRGAETSGGKCDFRSFKQESAGNWRVQAVCSASGKSWSSDIGLKLNGPRLRWSSERGTETYVRCLTL